MLYYNYVYINSCINTQYYVKNNNIKSYKNNKLNNLFMLLFISQNKNIKYSMYIKYQYFNMNYLRNVFNVKLKEKNINAKNVLPKQLSKHILFKTKFKHFKHFKIKYFNEVIYKFLVNIWLKNSKNICIYIKKKLDNVHFKRHRAYFLFFCKIINKYIIPNIRILQIKGITLKFKGKLGRGGTARKKTIFFHKKSYSLSNKFLSLNKNTWDVWTKTGTVGCTFQIFF